MSRHNRQQQQHSPKGRGVASANAASQSEPQQQRQVSSSTTPSTNTGQETSMSLLQRLSHACQYHASHHYANNNANGASVLANPDDALDDIPARCRKDLVTLGTILPKVEQATNQQPTAAEIGHLCSFYQDVLVGGYCPHAPHLFNWGKGGTEGMFMAAVVRRKRIWECHLLIVDFIFILKYTALSTM